MMNYLSILAAIDNVEGAQGNQLILGILIGAIIVAALWWYTVVSNRNKSVEAKPSGQPTTLEPAATPAMQESLSATAAAPVADAPADANSISAELVAVITAAVHVAVGAGHRIVSVRPAETSWSQEGRRQIFASHSIR
ncbi:MAG: hypothetical protein SFY80_04070 [Verrucomicrobiota bacterium]|nr:hypothetical protein [Verrucomicrobiota bacterium]